MSDNSNSSPSHLAWVENGILYHEYHHELTLTGVLDTERESLALLRDHDLQVMPVIVLLRDIDKSNFKLTFADYGRVLSTFDLAGHASSIWIIGVPEEIKTTVMTISSYFSMHHIYLAENLQEAQKAAHEVQSSKRSVLDPE